MPHLSYWEKSIYFQDVDIAIVGAGIAGLCTGISLLEKDPALRVIILERNYLPLGASTKNAGFACFGSPTELLDDLSHHDESRVFSLFKKRFDGIQKLLSYTGTQAIDFIQSGGYELIHPAWTSIPLGEEEINNLNSKIYHYTGLKKYFYYADDRLKQFSFNGFNHLIANDHEAGLHPVKMIEVLTRLFMDKKGKVLFGAGLNKWIENESGVEIELHDQTRFNAKKLLFCVNGFANKLLPELDLRPARNQVLMIQPKSTLTWNGCFHMDRGFVYFRNADGKLLIGGGRNIDMEQEFTDEFGCNEKIKSFLVRFVQESILHSNDFTITDQWSGILGLGPEKKPIIKMLSAHTAVAVRMGGMGIAIGSLVGSEAADMIYNSIYETL